MKMTKEAHAAMDALVRQIRRDAFTEAVEAIQAAYNHEAAKDIGDFTTWEVKDLCVAAVRSHALKS